MCGIAGCYQQADGRKLTDVMTDRIAHRGPDAGGVWSHEDERVSLHLGHRRLSIIDLSAAADQPLRKGNLALVYNGELYNYKELRAELQAAGATFVTASDTEVVLEGWRHWGPAALRPVPRYVRVRARRHGDRRARARPRPAGHQAPLLPGARRRDRVRLRAEGDHRRPSARNCGSSRAR